MDPVGSFQELEEFTVCMFLISCKHGKNIHRVLLSRGLKRFTRQNYGKRNDTDAVSVLLVQRRVVAESS